MAMGLLIGALATAVIEKLVSVASAHVGDYLKRLGVDEELQQLKKLLPKIESVVDAAERGEQQIPDPLREWLRQLKDALLEADDVLDDLDYFQLKHQAEADVNKSKAKKYIKTAKSILKPDPTLKKLRRVTKKLGEVAADARDFVVLLPNAQLDIQQREIQTIRDRQSMPFLTMNKVFGREGDRGELLRWLTGHEDGSNMNVSLFSVVGHGGMGKTTLAQLVFNDTIIQDSFDLKIWVYVSTSFDLKSISISILESATNQRPQVDGLPALLGALKKKLETSGKFLLILDDVWNDDDSSNWEKLLAPLKCGHKGSKILLTTRTDRVADMAARAMGASAKGSLKLGGLPGEDFSSLFNHYAFAGVDYKNYPNLQRIGMQIAKRLGSSPLAAKTVGGLLNYNLDERHWNKVLHSKNISAEGQQGKDNIMSILMLSYHHLPLHLRPCFAYCGMFPKGHKFRKEDLVLMWMAVGLIQGEMAPEDTGGDYFDELLRRSLFDHGDDDDYVMHDLLHDLAQSVSHGECSSFVDNDNKVEDAIPNTVRHLYMEIGNLDTLPTMDSWHYLCSLVLVINDRTLRRMDFSAFEKVLRSLKSIRMLCVSLGYDVLKMPDAFSHLIHLRSLQIYGGCLQPFPRSLCNLYHLQVLKFRYDAMLPESVNKLVKLRHLSASTWATGVAQVAGVGKLISLQELVFSVEKESGYKIEELGDLIRLRTLVVQGLENVENQEEARRAKLCNKKDLQTLDLSWSVSSDAGMDNHELVLDHLQPHANLKELTIRGYRGIRYANWMGIELINNLRHIHLFNCRSLDHLPLRGRLPYLEKFKLEYMPIKKIDFQCPRLKELHINMMTELEELSEPGEDAGQPHLHTLRIKNCRKLAVLPSLSMSIRELYLANLGLVTLPTLSLDCSNTCSTSGPSSSLLEDLEIHSCWNITSLGEGLLQLQQYLTTLERLEIMNCPELVDFPSVGLQHLRALKELRIMDCPKLRVAPSPITPPDENDDKFLPSSLQSLSIYGCPELSRADVIRGFDGAPDSMVRFHIDGFSP